MTNRRKWGGPVDDSETPKEWSHVGTTSFRYGDRLEVLIARPKECEPFITITIETESVSVPLSSFSKHLLWLLSAGDATITSPAPNKTIDEVLKETVEEVRNDAARKDYVDSDDDDQLPF